MRFTSILISTSMIAGILACSCHPHKDTADAQSHSHAHKEQEASFGLLGSEAYNRPMAADEPMPTESEYLTGPHDEDGSIYSPVPLPTNAPELISGIFGTEIPFPSNPVLSDIEESLLSSIVPTASGEREIFISNLAGLVPSGSKEKSEFVASITSNVGQATDAHGFSSRLSGALASATADPSASGFQSVVAASKTASASAPATSSAVSGAGKMGVEVKAVAILVGLGIAGLAVM
ncbi:hypothetical protein FN846DRAFT_534634 [Sphaerosporella brunnea]|uniref:Uncharacterized protein n=1 Tax=Sphaerosporella brunnea TaxID=1250544 RepID=A0A5J5F2P7_9PEZI|nr:hypothetical protein FN846DRAFT_534634 [Sphaerosporella brunnea]